MRKLLLLTCLSLALTATAEVYRWTDASGQVHYGEHPPPQGAQRIELPAAAAPIAPDQDDQRRRERQQRLLDAYEYERGQKAAAAALAAEKREADAERCRQLQGSWRRLTYAGPVYIRREDGGREYLDDVQREQEKARLLPAYVRACGRQPD